MNQTALRYDLSAIAVELAALRVWLLLRKYSPDQPRVPAGQTGGGQWTSGDGGGDATIGDIPIGLVGADGTGDAVPAVWDGTWSGANDSPGVTQVADGSSSGDSAGSGLSRYLEHDYTSGPNLVCGAELACSQAEMVDQLSRFSVPGRDPSMPAEHDHEYFVTDPRNGLPGGFVTTQIKDDGLTIINTTGPLHMMYNGQIIRSAFQTEDGAWYVTTHGTGLNVIPGMNIINQWQGPLIFDELDRRMRASIERRHGGKRANQTLETGRWTPGAGFTGDGIGCGV